MSTACTLPVTHCDCIVIGAGASGLLVARRLARAGLKLVVLERGAIGRESSWAGGGILSPLYPWRYDPAVNALAGWSQRAFAQLSAELHAATGIDPEWTPNGMLYLGGLETEAARAWAAAQGASLEALTPPDARGLEPRLARQQQCALWMAQIAQVRNPRLMQALALEARQLGIDVREHVEVHGPAIQSGRVRGVRSSAGRFEAPRVVVATGAWTGALLAGLPQPPAIAPVRGQMIVFRAEPGWLTRIVMRDAHYLIPRRDGRILAGSTVEFVGFDKSTTDDAYRTLHAAALAIAPGLADFPVEHHWSGLRPGAPAGIPYIGEHPDIGGLYVNAGHYRNGLVTGPASAQLLANLILDETPILDPAPYGLSAGRL